MKRNRHGFYDFCCFWCAVWLCILGAVGVFFALDIVFSTFGMGVGVEKWMTQRHGYDVCIPFISLNSQKSG
jgi:uncharacterized membrane protein